MTGCGDGTADGWHVSSWGWADDDGRPAMMDAARFRLWSVTKANERVGMLLVELCELMHSLRERISAEAVVAIRVQDMDVLKGAVSTIAPERVGLLVRDMLGVPVYVDPDVPADTVRFERADGTHTDLVAEP